MKAVSGTGYCARRTGKLAVTRIWRKLHNELSNLYSSSDFVTRTMTKYGTERPRCCMNKNEKFGLENLKGRNQLGYVDKDIMILSCQYVTEFNLLKIRTSTKLL
jgi:hypothetical protein